MIKKMSIVEFNKNVSDSIRQTEDEEVIYIRRRGRTVAVLLSKKVFEDIMRFVRVGEKHEQDKKKQNTQSCS
jgi:PHD/YefM family antitoxin component YafN of YafNO toxin-antitoxin module